MQVHLPDGSARTLEEGASAADLAKSIGSGLARAAVAARVDGEVRDLARPLADGAEVAILTKKDPEALDVLRHSAAHLMADAILRLFPGAQLTIGPVVEDGFYYDLFFEEGGVTPEDFPKIEQEMKRIAKEARPFERCAVADKEADERFARYRAIDGGSNPFKREIVEEIEARGDEITLYRHGDFVDLCRGPPRAPHRLAEAREAHQRSAGAYWRADAEREQLVRVYGTAFFSKQDLKEHLTAARGGEASAITGCSASSSTCSSFHEEAPGFPFFHPNGTVLWTTFVTGTSCEDCCGAVATGR